MSADTPQPQDEELVEAMRLAMQAEPCEHSVGRWCCMTCAARAALAVARPLVVADVQRQIADALDAEHAMLEPALEQRESFAWKRATQFVRSLPLISDEAREIPPGTLPPPITVEVWDNWEGTGEPIAAEIADVVRIGSRWHVVCVVPR